MGGEGVLPLRSYAAKLRPKGVLFSGFRYNERVGILLTEVFKRVGKSVIWVCEMAQRARTDEFYDFIKSGKRSIFVIDSYLNDNALDAMF